jgi:hypothetical protein
VSAARANIVRALADTAVAFGGEHHVGTADADIFQRLSGELFRIAFGIDVCCVD